MPSLSVLHHNHRARHVRALLVHKCRLWRHGGLHDLAILHLSAAAEQLFAAHSRAIIRKSTRVISRKSQSAVTLRQRGGCLFSITANLSGEEQIEGLFTTACTVFCTRES